MSKDDARKLHAELKAHYESCVTKAPFAKVFGMKELENNGNVMFSAKRNGVNGQGDENPKGQLYRRNEAADDGPELLGRLGRQLKVTAYPVTDPNGLGGISLLLDIVQVTKAVYGGGGLDDFDEVAPTGGSHAEFDTPPASNPFADIPKTAANDLTWTKSRSKAKKNPAGGKARWV